MVDVSTFGMAGQSNNILPSAHTLQCHGLLHLIQSSDHFSIAHNFNFGFFKVLFKIRFTVALEMFWILAIAIKVSKLGSGKCSSVPALTSTASIFSL